MFFLNPRLYYWLNSPLQQPGIDFPREANECDPSIPQWSYHSVSLCGKRDHDGIPVLGFCPQLPRDAAEAWAETAGTDWNILSFECMFINDPTVFTPFLFYGSVVCLQDWRGPVYIGRNVLSSLLVLKCNGHWHECKYRFSWPLKIILNRILHVFWQPRLHLILLELSGKLKCPPGGYLTHLLAVNNILSSISMKSSGSFPHSLKTNCHPACKLIKVSKQTPLFLVDTYTKTNKRIRRASSLYSTFSLLWEECTVISINFRSTFLNLLHVVSKKRKQTSCAEVKMTESRT